MRDTVTLGCSRGTGSSDCTARLNGIWNCTEDPFIGTTSILSTLRLTFSADDFDSGSADEATEDFDDVADLIDDSLSLRPDCSNSFTISSNAPLLASSRFVSSAFERFSLSSAGSLRDGSGSLIEAVKTTV